MAKSVGKVTSKRVPVLVDAAVYEQFKQMSEITGKPVARCVNESLTDWYDSVGVVQMEAIQEAVATGRAALANVVQINKGLRSHSRSVIAVVDEVLEQSRSVVDESEAVLNRTMETLAMA